MKLQVPSPPLATNILLYALMKFTISCLILTTPLPRGLTVELSGMCHHTWEINKETRVVIPMLSLCDFLPLIIMFSMFYASFSESVIVPCVYILCFTHPSSVKDFRAVSISWLLQIMLTMSMNMQISLQVPAFSSSVYVMTRSAGVLSYFYFSSFLNSIFISCVCHARDRTSCMLDRYPATELNSRTLFLMF